MNYSLIAQAVVTGQLRVGGTDITLPIRLDLCATDGRFRWFVENGGGVAHLYTIEFGGGATTLDEFDSVEGAIETMQTHRGGVFEITGSKVESIHTKVVPAIEGA